MLDPQLIQQADKIRRHYLEAVKRIQQAPSFEALKVTAEKLRTETKECEQLAAAPRLQQAFATSFACTFVGSSGHGKTSILAEMFPNLENRGWLNTDVTDTTSQALIIRFASSNAPDLNGAIVRSWTAAQIKRLVRLADEENRGTNVVVRYRDGYVEVDGSAATFTPEDMGKFRFPLKQRLCPLPRPWPLTSTQLGSRDFLRTLTVKETSERVPVGPVLSVDGQAFDALQLRAVVREVELHDDFAQIIAWAGGDQASIGDVVFIDTPGLKVVGSIKDEVLRHVLGKKNQQIVVELLRNDELDIIIHVVLCGQQSAFGELWKAVVEQCSLEELADLGDRLILAVNGANLYFNNADLRRRWEMPGAAQREGDQFAVTIEDNILKKMSERGTVHPARICFVDSKRIVESPGLSYQEFYARFRPVLDQWSKPGGTGYATLQRLRIVNVFQQNVVALCDPDDRGQGFLIRQILDLVRDNGPKLFLRKHLIRTGLVASILKLQDNLLRYYDGTGQLNYRAIQEAVRHCLPRLDPNDPEALEKFAIAVFDPIVAGIVPGMDTAIDREKWVDDAFKALCQRFYQALVSRPGINKEAVKPFTYFLNERVKIWRRDWGYRTARMPPPTRQQPATAELLSHALKVHVRELLYQLLSQEQGDAAVAISQDPKDQEHMRQALAALEEAQRMAETLCRQHGVSL